MKKQFLNHGLFILRNAIRCFAFAVNSLGKMKVAALLVKLMVVWTVSSARRQVDYSECTLYGKVWVVKTANRALPWKDSGGK